MYFLPNTHENFHLVFFSSIVKRTGMPYRLSWVTATTDMRGTNCRFCSHTHHLYLAARLAAVNTGS